MIADYTTVRWDTVGAAGSGLLNQGAANITWSSDFTINPSGAAGNQPYSTWMFDQVVIQPDWGVTAYGTMAGYFALRVQWGSNLPIQGRAAGSFPWVDDTYLTPSTAAGVTSLTPSTNELQISKPTAPSQPGIWTLPVMGEIMRIGVYCSAAPQAGTTVLQLWLKFLTGNPAVQP